MLSLPGLASIRFDPILPFLACLCGDLGFSAVFRFLLFLTLLSDFPGDLGSSFLCLVVRDLYLDRTRFFVGYGLFGFEALVFICMALSLVLTSFF